MQQSNRFGQRGKGVPPWADSHYYPNPVDLDGKHVVGAAVRLLDDGYECVGVRGHEDVGAYRNQ
jgi:hypothetical protein